ncbi:MAG: sugar phosphate nucleotidyltransferase [Tissierellaceae bacterium]
MKAIILCGGEEIGLQPITYTNPKELIPIANKPLFIYTIEALLNADIDEIGVVVNRYNKLVFERTLSKYFTHNLKYIVQNNPNDIIEGLLLCEEFVDEEKFIVILGNNSSIFDLKKFARDFINSKSNCKLLLKEVDEPENYSVAYIGDNRIIELEERPKVAFSNLAITGVYGFDNNIFNICKEVDKDERKRFKITDILKKILHNGYNIEYEVSDGYWKNIVEHKDIIEENIKRLDLIEEDIKGEIVNSQTSGRIILEEGAVVYNSVVRGPAIIGANSIIQHSYIGPYTSIGKRVNIQGSNIESSIILYGANILGVESPIDYSIIGEGSVVSNEKGLKRTNRIIVGRNSRVYLIK